MTKKNIQKNKPRYTTYNLRPLKIEIWPTQFCNLNCRYCRSENYVPKKKEIPDKILLELIDESASLGFKEWVIAGGGEPFARKRIVLEMIKKIKEHHLKGSLTTNGTLLNEKDIRKIVEMGWDNLFFSLDGPSSFYNDILRKKGSFDKVIKNIKSVNYFKKKLKSEKPYLGISMVLTKDNYISLQDMLKLADALKIGCVITNPIKGNNTGYNEKLKLDYKDIKILRKKVPELKKYADEKKIYTTLDILNTDLVEKSSNKITEESASFDCFEPFTSVLINSFGGVGPCCERPDDPEQDSVINKSLKEVWKGNYFNKIREKNTKSSKCFYCNAWKITDKNNARLLLKK